MHDFSQRSTQEEIMDDLNTPEKELRINLRELEVVNEYLGGYSVIISALDKMQLSTNISIMDIGSGGGDTLRAIAKWFRKKNKRASLTGIDWNDVMTRYAKEHSKAYPDISFRTIDIFNPKLDNEKADIVTCSLFCHHFVHNNLVELVKRMHELAIKHVIINDLHRHWLAYYSIKVLTAVFSKTYVVKNDAPLSVARALTRKEWIQVMQDASISNYEIKWKWAFRWLIIINKSPN